MLINVVELSERIAVCRLRLKASGWITKPSEAGCTDNNRADRYLATFQGWDRGPTQKFDRVGPTKDVFVSG